MERKRKRAEEEESTQIEYMQNYPELIVVVGYGVWCSIGISENQAMYNGANDNDNTH